MSYNKLNHPHRYRCRCCYSWAATIIFIIIIIAVTLLLQEHINSPTHVFVTAFVTGPATTRSSLAPFKPSNVNRNNQNKMSHRIAAVKKLQSSIIRQHRRVVAASTATAGTTEATTTTKSERENDNSKSHGPSTRNKTTTTTDNTTDTPRTRHSRQPLSPLQRRIFDDVRTAKSNNSNINRPPVAPPVAIRRVGLSTAFFQD